MPELPEVERTRELLREHCEGRTAERVEVHQDSIVFQGPDTTPDGFAAHVRGRTVTGIGRRGKVLWLELDKPPHVVCHLGMTGYVSIENVDGVPYRQAKKEPAAWPEEKPKYWKFVIAFAKGTSETQPLRIAFCDARRLGRIRLVDEIKGSPPVSELGFDPIINMPSLEDYTAKVRKRKMPVKALLLDQAFNAGVGNYLADEILYQARVHPSQATISLTDDEIELLWKKTTEVCQKTVELKADTEAYPEDWLFHRRWNKNSKKATIMADGNHVKWETVGGRTSAFVPAVQKLHDGNGSATRAVKRLSDNDSLGGTAKRDQLTKNGKSRKRGRANAEGDDDPAKTPEPPRKKRAASGRRARV